jgi:hypothetical protein
MVMTTPTMAAIEACLSFSHTASRFEILSSGRKKKQKMIMTTTTMKPWWMLVVAAALLAPDWTAQFFGTTTLFVAADEIGYPTVRLFAASS